jgi:DNA-binding transcriptional ArsR family regulator
METKATVQALSALAHEGRLAVFRELVKAGPAGLAAGEIARRLGILPNTLSASLAVLSHAGLVGSLRQGRSIIYAVRYERMAEVMGFLLQDCCDGSPAVCAPLLSIVTAATCCTVQPEAQEVA